ncbi:fimbrial protein [Citrobacter amalonaticus]|uniref:fimbrial protein n=1 Tax=Citrobacter amalonaticus TaxID=35703 RepID=UPI00292B3EB4|nr:fimbrial protein [Citrobacter amalonaticus]MDV0787617.1 fimbrial protein [Citrobacter amalonaticus]MEB0643681.1 fimbrial protein [Citrobacter amalonaticus]
MNKLIWLVIVFLSVMLFSERSMALSCRYGSNASSSNPTGSILQSFPVGSVSFPRSAFTKGTLLWRSSTYTATFTCWDTNNFPRGEDAFIYWNPQGDLAKVDPSFNVGVTINGVDYDNINTGRGVKGPNLGPGTRYNGTRKATPLTVSVSFSIYIKATGRMPPSTFVDVGRMRIFQVDGVLGLNGSPNSNYNAQLTNFNNIKVIECAPTVNITGTSANTIDFGTVMKEISAAGKIAKTVPFTVSADVHGGGCKGQQLVVSFSSSNTSSSDRSMIIPPTNPGVGIYITPNDSSERINLGQTYIFSNSILDGNATTVTKNYKAYLQWLTNTPEVGRFSATTVVSITFK